VEVSDADAAYEIVKKLAPPVAESATRWGTRSQDSARIGDTLTVRGCSKSKSVMRIGPDVREEAGETRGLEGKLDGGASALLWW